MADHIEDSIELKSNNLAQIQSRISAAERQVEGIEEQMEKLRSAYDAQISELRRQRDAKALEIASHKNLLSPVHQLPIEVLSKIFELSCSPDADIAPEHDIIRRTFVLSKICVHWRKVAHDTPRIWSRLCLSESQHLKAITGDVVWVGEWLSRSRGLPIELHLNFLNPYSRRQDITRGMYKLLQHALTHRHRIQILNLSGNMNCFLPIFRLPPSSLPLLKKLSLHSASQDPFPYYIDIQAFLGSLELSQVELSKSGPNTDFLESLILPTTQLVALQVKDTSSSFPKLPVYVDLFQQCPNLVNLIIDLQMSSGFDPTISISLPSLKFLDIVCRQLSQGVSLLHCLVVPSLQDLSLHWCGLSFPEFSRDIDRLRNHSESASRLTSLTVYIRWLYTNDDLTSILALFPRVTSVRIYRIEFDVSAFLRAMTYSRGDPVLLPKILDLELGFKTLTDRQSYYPSELVPMILSRSWPARSHPDTEITSRQVMDLEDDVTNEVCRLQKFNLYGSWLKEPDEELIAGIPGLTFEYHPNGCK
ncbi:hypothetical protein DFH05DRAFT_1446353 [Lentinula detonsa]|uniref:F-box domain-containing protein n=1 Tax=Lentinula detonsa TaxID=2804962 RepID=A0A9W8NZG9_9AGAR|nr:hypothetical protein DFH05DRAFT_1446353 [Lentinula detonsa]